MCCYPLLEQVTYDIHDFGVIVTLKEHAEPFFVSDVLNGQSEVVGTGTIRAF